MRSERRRATILAGLFAFAACIYTLVAFAPGLLDPELSARFQDRWPWFMSLYIATVTYEWALRGRIGWLIENRRQPHLAHRFLNAFFEASIPTVMMLMAVSLMGPRDALGSPAFLLYFFFILLSILQLDIRLCLFIGIVAACENFIFAQLVIGRAAVGSPPLWQTSIFHFIRSLIIFVAGMVAGLIAQEIKRQTKSPYGLCSNAIRRFGSLASTYRRRLPTSCFISQWSLVGNYEMSASCFWISVTSVAMRQTQDRTP